MSQINVQQFFSAVKDITDGNTRLETNAAGQVVQSEAAPQNKVDVLSFIFAGELPQRLKHLDAFWTAIKDSPLYGKASANYVKGLFDDARSNADIPLTARFIRSVQYFLNDQIHLSIRNEVLAKGLISPEHMDRFMYALVNGKLALGQNRAHVTQRAVASFLRMTFTPEYLHKHVRPGFISSPQAAMKLGLYDLQKNTTLNRTLEECVKQGQSYNLMRDAVLGKLQSQLAMLEKLERGILDAITLSDKGRALFRAFEKVMDSQIIYGLDPNRFMRICLSSSLEGNSLRTIDDIEKVLDIYRRSMLDIYRRNMLEQEAGAHVADLQQQVLATSPQVQDGMQQYLEKSYGQQENYTAAQRSSTRGLRRLFSYQSEHAGEAGRQRPAGEAGQFPCCAAYDGGYGQHECHD